MKNIIIEDIDVEVAKKKIKNIRISIQPPDGKVKLSVPYNMNEDEVRIFLISKLSWIKKHKSKFKLQERQRPNEFLSGEIHYLFGKEYLLNVLEASGKQYVEIDADRYINLYIRQNSTKEKREKIMIQWYREELKKIIPKYIGKWEAVIGVKVEDWGVKLMKTRWGTCNIQAKRIWINLEFAKKDTIFLDYIIVHEMVHLLERKHNDNFKFYMDKFLPNWRKIQSELNGMVYEA